MFVVLLKFSRNKARAGQFMEEHMKWIKSGFDDGVFLMTGSLLPELGGGLLAHDISLPDLKDRLKEDPFVAEDIVDVEILEISPSRTDERLSFVLN